MAKKRKKPEPLPLAIFYDRRVHGWVIKNAPRHVRPFATKLDAENHCIKKFGRCPITQSPNISEYPDLPHNSVWTGAPWDHAFKHV